MTIGKFKARDVQPTALRLHPEVREELARLAVANGRSLSKEISTRLQVSLAPTDLPTRLAQAIDLGRHGPASGTTPYPTSSAQVHHTNNVNPAPNDKSPANAITDIDRAMLDVFHTLPPEKQLALLSLFR